MTEQEIFDTVARHLLTQRKKSSSNPGNCLYRGPNGLKCAVGCLIHDKEYQPTMEGIGVDVLSAEELLPRRLRRHTDLLNSLQLIHDYEPPSRWRRHLRSLARYRHLSPAVLDEGGA